MACWPVAAQASAELCEQQAAVAEQRYGLPPQLLRAIARVESGRAQAGVGLRAWPWTANVAGQGHYFDTRDAALRYLDDVRAGGQDSFDVGCMQLNYRWHGDQFASLAQMLDPVSNTDYAARFLRDLYQETGDWETATRYYHSRSPEFGHAYLARVQRAMADWGQQATRVAQVAGLPAQGAPIAVTVSGPLISVAAGDAYWDSPALGPGIQPRMPD